MPHTALTLGNANDVAAVSAYLQDLGFSVGALSDIPDVSEVDRLQALAPVLLVVGVQGFQADIGSLSGLSSALRCEVILVGDHTAQARFSHLVEQGLAMYLRLPLDDDFVTELFKDIYQVIALVNTMVELILKMESHMPFLQYIMPLTWVLVKMQVKLVKLKILLY